MAISRTGLILAAVPFVLLPAYVWYVFQYDVDSIVTPRLRPDHRAIKLAVFYTLTFFPVSLCFLLPGAFLRVRAWTPRILPRVAFTPLLALLLLVLLWICSNEIRRYYPTSMGRGTNAAVSPGY